MIASPQFVIQHSTFRMLVKELDELKDPRELFLGAASGYGENSKGAERGVSLAGRSEDQALRRGRTASRSGRHW